MSTVRAAIYARVSTRDEGQTNDNQLLELRAFAQWLGYAVYRSIATKKTTAQPSGRSSNSSSPMSTSGGSLWCCSGAWTASAGNG